ncbi:mediator of RNA polymerase II transcription subunit 11 [Neocloeon triangulifer]|uniref:mediator of RNA polymerase II transcription subunit 11 n=1 Tax=Neocloeon triangulifer TaxID=2078957 RepID=UPI00286F0629|nr:mediator of RNA polymerase II transcription subunit 11 [Neocloeon triangulifer]
MSQIMDRLQVLNQIETDVIACMQSAGQALLELSKEKSSLKQAETHTTQFLKTLNNVETKLSDQINYLTQVSTGQPHEGSGYASAKVLQMAWHRLEHVRSRINNLEKIKNKHLGARPPSAPRLSSQQQPITVPSGSSTPVSSGAPPTPTQPPSLGPPNSN